MGIQAWRLDSPRQTLVLTGKDSGLPEVVYWGDPLPADEDLTNLAVLHRIDVAGGTLMEAMPISLSPEASRVFQGQPGMVVAQGDGTPLRPRFALVDADASETVITFRAADGSHGLRYTARLAIDPETEMLELSAALEADAPIRVHWLAAPVLPAPAQADEMIDFHGRWTGEFFPVRTPWGPGIREREARTGRSGHEHFPGLVVPCSGATNIAGRAYAFHYGWSGGHRMVAEELPDGRRQIQFGHTSGSELAAGTAFETAKLYATYSAQGLNGCATAFQHHLRDRVLTPPKPAAPRPVHYNCWEAIYFEHDLPTLKDIATRAAALGAERFVLDDGWFGKRDNDLSSLGDWDIDRRKWPDGLTPLIDHVKAEGMTFGLWFEPEMINPDSDLYRAHPDWILGEADQTRGRHQLVLDMSRAEVRDHLFEKISDTLSTHDIEYVKWDHNRILPIADAAQARGAYALFDRLRTAHPGVEIESCSSGGGRIDFGVLERTHRVWLSDSNDAVERLRMQHEAALFLPTVVTGSHVGPRFCHTSGRILDIEFRAWVAAQRHMGIEMDPRELDERETEVLSRVIAWYKANRDWMHGGDILRLDSADDSVIAEQQIAKDGSKFVIFSGKFANSEPSTQRPLQLTALEPAARYRLTLVSRVGGAGSPIRPEILSGPIEASGAWLMNHGLQLPTSWPAIMWTIEGVRLEAA
ncbi:MAG: alpha-galactosidase [Pseudomonadota bacterium]